MFRSTVSLLTNLLIMAWMIQPALAETIRGSDLRIEIQDRSSFPNGYSMQLIDSKQHVVEPRESPPVSRPVIEVASR